MPGRPTLTPTLRGVGAAAPAPVRPSPSSTPASTPQHPDLVGPGRRRLGLRRATMTTPSDVDGHGTHVSGHDRRRQRQRRGHRGRRPGRRGHAAAGARRRRRGHDVDDIAEAFDWAGENGIRVVNASPRRGGLVESGVRRDRTSTPRPCSSSRPATAALTTWATTTTSAPQYPCAYASGATSSASAHRRHQTTSRRLLQLRRASPSTSSRRAWTSSRRLLGRVDVRLDDGTSMATPHVAGGCGARAWRRADADARRRSRPC